MVLGVAAMLMFYSPGNHLIFIATCMFIFGMLLYTVGSLIAVRRTAGA